MCVCVCGDRGEQRASKPPSRTPHLVKVDLSCVLFTLFPLAASCLPRLPPPAPLMRLLLLGSVSYPPPSPPNPPSLLRLRHATVSILRSYPPPPPPPPRPCWSPCGPAPACCGRPCPCPPPTLLVLGGVSGAMSRWVSIRSKSPSRQEEGRRCVLVISLCCRRR